MAYGSLLYYYLLMELSGYNPRETGGINSKTGFIVLDAGILVIILHYYETLKFSKGSDSTDLYVVCMEKYLHLQGKPWLSV